jgi:hypothetical protein
VSFTSQNWNENIVGANFEHFFAQFIPLLNNVVVLVAIKHLVFLEVFKARVISLIIGIQSYFQKTIILGLKGFGFCKKNNYFSKIYLNVMKIFITQKLPHWLILYVVFVPERMTFVDFVSPLFCGGDRELQPIAEV